MLAALSSLYPCDLGIDVLLLHLGRLRVLLFFCLSLQSIYDCDHIPEWPVCMQFLQHLTFVDGHPQHKNSDSMLRCSSCIVAALISSAIMQCSMSVHDSILLMVMHRSGISLTLFHGWVWLANLQWIIVVQAFIVFLCRIDGLTIILLEPLW